LATIYDSGQEDTIRDLVGSTAVWLGFNDREVEGHFQWLDHVKGYSTYTNWRPNEPNDANGEDCLVGYYHSSSTNNFAWNDLPCTHSRAFVCGPQYVHVEEAAFAASLSSTTPQTLDGNEPSLSGIRTDSGENGWKCAVDAPNDSDGTQWFEPSYTGMSSWVTPLYQPHSDGFAPEGVDFVGIQTTASNVTSIHTSTGMLYCVYKSDAAAVVDPTEHVLSGGFEAPTSTSWQNANSFDGANQQPPDWVVTSGSVDWGRYEANGHCTGDCMPEGVQGMDMCGGASGRIEQDVLTTLAATEYVLSYAINAHGSCGAAEKTMNVYVNDALVATETKTRCGGWGDFANCWEYKQQTVTGVGTNTKISFEAVDSSCGCMFLDDVSLKVAP